MAHFPEGWWETEHRNVDTGTIWEQWPGTNYNPGTEVVNGSVVLSQPDYSILDDFETGSNVLNFNLQSSSEQTAAKSFDWSFRGDLSLLLEHESGFNNFSWDSNTTGLLDLSQPYDFGNEWITSVIHLDEWPEGTKVAPPAVRGYDPNAPGYILPLVERDSSGLKLTMSLDLGGSATTSIPNAQSVIDGDEPLVCYTRNDSGGDVYIRVAPLSTLSDSVYLSNTLGEYTAKVEDIVSDGAYGEWVGLDWGGSGVGSLYVDYLLSGVST